MPCGFFHGWGGGAVLNLYLYASCMSLLLFGFARRVRLLVYDRRPTTGGVAHVGLAKDPVVRHTCSAAGLFLESKEGLGCTRSKTANLSNSGDTQSALRSPPVSSESGFKSQ